MEIGVGPSNPMALEVSILHGRLSVPNKTSQLLYDDATDRKSSNVGKLAHYKNLKKYILGFL